MLIAIDTATRFASVCLYDEQGIVEEHAWRSNNNHSVETLPVIHNMLTRQGIVSSDIAAIAVVTGPGSFTGLRIGMSIGKGLALALGIPILGIPTLDVTAYAAGDPGMPVLAVLEIGRNRICVGRYTFQEGLPVLDQDTLLVSTQEWVADASEPVFVTGEISEKLATRLLAQDNAENISLSSMAGSIRRSGYLAELAWERFSAGESDNLDTLSPVYAHHPQSGTGSEA